LILLLVTFLMTTSLSRPVWAVVPKLSEVQFPWRWLSITSLMGALLVAASIPKWKEQFLAKLRPRDLAVLLAFALSIVFIGTQIIQDCDYIKRARFESMAQEVRGAVTFKDWLPVWARDFNKIEKTVARADAGTRPVTVTAWEPEHRTFQIAPGPESTLRVGTYFYPHWKANAEGRLLPTTPTADGLLLISIPTQATNIELSFERPARVHMFEMVSVVTWLLIIGSLVWSMFMRTSQKTNP